MKQLNENYNFVHFDKMHVRRECRNCRTKLQNFISINVIK